MMGRIAMILRLECGRTGKAFNQGADKPMQLRLFRRALLAIVALWAFLLAAAPSPAQALQPGPQQPVAPSSPPPPDARIVIQGKLSTNVEVAAWTPDSRYLFMATGHTREVLMWDVQRNVIVDRVQLPAAGSNTGSFQFLTSMAMTPDGLGVRIEAEVFDAAAASFRVMRSYEMTVSTRRIFIKATRPVPPRPKDVEAAYIMDKGQWLLQRDNQSGAAAGWPTLPRSPDGQWQAERSEGGIVLKSLDGKSRTMRVQLWLGGKADADLSPDDRLLATLVSSSANIYSEIDMIEMASGRHLPVLKVPGAYGQLRWLSPSEYLLLPADNGNEPSSIWAYKGEPPPFLRIEAATGKTLTKSASRCFMTLSGRGLVGAGLANCRAGAGSDRTLQTYRATGWAPLKAFTLPEGALIRMIAASADGTRLFVLTKLPDRNFMMYIVAADSGKILKQTRLPAQAYPSLASFSPDGRSIWLAVYDKVREWSYEETSANGDDVYRDFPVATFWPKRFSTRNGYLTIGGPLEDFIQIVNLANGTTIKPAYFPMAIGLGYMRTRPFWWAVSILGELRIWHLQTGKVVLTTTFLPNQRFVTSARDGRYDTNIGPDSSNFRWLISDQPMESLAPQTLMRDFYEPRLFTKLLDCTAANNCEQKLKPLPELSSLNRQLPQVRITNIKPADTPGQVVVRVEARETRNAQSGRRSGLFNVKLLLNNRQIAQEPPHFQQQPSPTLAQWRELNQMEGVNAAGVWTSEFQVSVPTHHDGKPMEFAAYAFNSDRVKSDTARRSWTPPATSTPKRPRRAWVLTIGVDDYVEPRLKLNFAVADARVIAERLAAIPGYEMRHISLTSAPAADGRPARQVTRADVLGVLSFLAGFPPEMSQMIRLEDVHKVRNLAETSPDDIVIISFSGHGFATASGQFALLPSNARWPATALTPETRSVITAEDLTIQLGFMKAAEIAFIIDACHSGAAVNTPDFKPGPMGDASLGQLSFDKGLRILAATQADDVALENAALKQGFLTAALGEGLTDTGGPADLNNDGRIVLDEWLRYAVARLPSLHEDLARGGGTMAARGVRLVMRTPTAPPKVQEPSLFDFNSAPSPVVLRGRATQ